MSDPGKLTAWQRWELPSFDGLADPAAVAAVLPTAQQIEQIQQSAREEGYQAGHAEGYAAGYAAGMQQAVAEAEKLTGLMNSLEQELGNVDQQIAQDMLDVALEVARQVLMKSLEVKPELLLGVVSEAIASLPHFNQTAHLVLNPKDAEIVRTHMGEQLAHTGWKIFEDPQIARGGCRVDTANTQIDASLATRWKRVVGTLSQDASWLPE